jgi:ferrous iron transport protein A
MQLIGNNRLAHRATLLDLAPGEEATLLELNLPDEVAHRLMILGFVPGSTVAYTRPAPGGDPRVYRVDGADVALRSETARQIHLDRSM